MKRFIIISLSILILSFVVNAQRKEVVFEPENLYHKALNAVLDKRLESYGNFIDKEELNNVTILKEHLTIYLPGKIGNFKIDYLREEELFTKYKKYRKKKREWKNNENNESFSDA